MNKFKDPELSPELEQIQVLGTVPRTCPELEPAAVKRESRGWLSIFRVKFYVGVRVE